MVLKQKILCVNMCNIICSQINIALLLDILQIFKLRWSEGECWYDYIYYVYNLTKAFRLIGYLPLKFFVC